MYCNTTICERLHIDTMYMYFIKIVIYYSEEKVRITETIWYLHFPFFTSVLSAMVPTFSLFYISVVSIVIGIDIDLLFFFVTSLQTRYVPQMKNIILQRLSPIIPPTIPTPIVNKNFFIFFNGFYTFN